jgi:hypothetical protein
MGQPGRPYRLASLGGVKCRQKAETASALLSNRPKREWRPFPDLTASKPMQQQILLQYQARVIAASLGAPS